MQTRDIGAMESKLDIYTTNTLKPTLNGDMDVDNVYKYDSLDAQFGKNK